MGAEVTPSGSDDKGSEEQVPLLDKSGSREDPKSETVIPVTSQSLPTPYGFVFGPRPCRDKAFLIVFLVFLVTSLAVGILAGIFYNPDFQLLDTIKNNPACVANTTHSLTFTGENSETTLQAGEETRNMWTRVHLYTKRYQGGEDPQVKPLQYSLIATLLLCLPISIFVLWLLRTYTAQLVYLSLPFVILIPLAAAVSSLLFCLQNKVCKEEFVTTYQLVSIGVIIGLCGLFVWSLYYYWDRVELTIRIVKTAAEALHKNLGLVLVLPCLSVGVFFYLVPAAISFLYAEGNGKIISNPELEVHSDIHCGIGVKCCTWKKSPWVPPYQFLTAFSMLWAIMVISEAQIFTISGTVAQWYFASTDSSLVGAKRRALRNAFGPSFGTVCFSGLVLSIVQMIRAAVDKSRTDSSQEGILACLLRACLECLLSAVEFVTKFTTYYASIKGSGFCASAYRACDLLSRNALSTVMVETIAGRLLASTAFLVSALYGALVYGVLCLVVNGGSSMWLVATTSGLLLFFVLIFFMQVLNNVVDTVYMCYAIDKDHSICSKKEVHDVLVLLPPSKEDRASLAVPS